MNSAHPDDSKVCINNFKKFLVIVVTSSLILSISACSSMSDSTKDQGKEVICAAGESLTAQIRTGGAAGKFAAGVVRDNSTGELQRLADRVSKGDGGEKAQQELGNYVRDLCV